MKANLKAVEQPAEAVEQQTSEVSEVPGLSESLPPLQVDATSFDARVAGVENCSVAREVSKHWATSIAFTIDREVEKVDPADYVAQHELKQRLWLEQWERKRQPLPSKEMQEHIAYIKSKATRFIDWDDIGQIWNTDPRGAMELWKAIRREARDEFIGGHYGARAFEVGVLENDAWRRAQYLAVRDGLIEEWKPRGASEFMLIDQMVQAYTMQLYWTEKAMRRGETAPRLETYQYTEWKRHRLIQERVNQWGEGEWDLPYQEEAEAVEQAFRLAEMCAKSFQRAARQLANIRLVRAKTARTRRRDRQRALRVVGSSRA
jgi:hypothetical protein